MHQSRKKRNPGTVRSSMIKVFVLVFIYTVLSSNLIFATSDSSSSSASGNGEATNSITDGEDSEVPVDYRKGMVSAGLYHTVLLRENGTVYCWGDNSYGQLGTGNTENKESPTLVPDLVGIVMVQAGAYHTMALSADGTVYVWGRNTFGQVGDGSSMVALKPVRIDSIPPMVSIAAGAYHSMALSIDGKVYVWGKNDDFQVGDVISENIVDETGNILGKRVLTPQLVVESGVAAIAAGGNHSLYLSTEGTVFAWGSNKYGQLGDGSQISRGLPTLVEGLSSVIQISAGYSHNMALTQTTVIEEGTGTPAASEEDSSNGSVGESSDTSTDATAQTGKQGQTYQSLYVWGSDSDGQLGLGEEFDENRFVDRPTKVDITGDTSDLNDRISLIQAGYSSSMVTVPVIKNDKRYDSIYVWGNNTYGQLGIGDLTSQNAPTVLIATSNGWTGSMFLPFQSIAIGGYHAVFLSVKGFVGISGRANKGQLGNVSSIDTTIPIGVLVPDAITPEWMKDESLQMKDEPQTVLLTWPNAVDNIKVTGYEVTYLTSGNLVKSLDLGDVTKLTLFDINQSVRQIVTVKAIDSSGNRSVLPLQYEYGPEGTLPSSAQQSGDSSSLPQEVTSQTDLSQDASGELLTDSTDTAVGSGSETSGTAESDTTESGILEPEPSVTEPVVTPEKIDPLVWSITLYGTIIPLEVPWNVDYVYGEGVVLPPKNYTWAIAIAVTVAIIVFFLFLGVVSFRKRHKGNRLFKSAAPDLSEKEPEAQGSPSAVADEDVVQIGDWIELLPEENPEDTGITQGQETKKRGLKQRAARKIKKSGKPDDEDKT